MLNNYRSEFFLKTHLIRAWQVCIHLSICLLVYLCSCSKKFAKEVISKLNVFTTHSKKNLHLFSQGLCPSGKKKKALTKWKWFLFKEIATPDWLKVIQYLVQYLSPHLCRNLVKREVSGLTMAWGMRCWEAFHYKGFLQEISLGLLPLKAKDEFSKTKILIKIQTLKCKMEDCYQYQYTVLYYLYKYTKSVIQYILYFVVILVTNSCVTLYDPMTVAHQAPLSMEFFSMQEYWSGLPFPPPGNLPDPEIEPTSPAPGQVDSLPAEPLEKPIYNTKSILNIGGFHFLWPILSY